MSFAILYSHSSLPFHIFIPFRSYDCFISVFLFFFPSFSFQKRCSSHHFQLLSIILQLIDLLKIAAIRPELSFVCSGAKLIWVSHSVYTKQWKISSHLCCYFCFLGSVLMSLPAFLLHSISSFLSENMAKYLFSLGATFSFYLYFILPPFFSLLFIWQKNLLLLDEIFFGYHDYKSIEI